MKFLEEAGHLPARIYYVSFYHANQVAHEEHCPVHQRPFLKPYDKRRKLKSDTFRISVTTSDMNTNIVGTYYATYIHIRGTLIGAEDNSAYMTN